MSDILTPRGSATAPRLEIDSAPEGVLTPGSGPGLAVPQFPPAEPRRRRVGWSFLLMVVLPAIAGIAYYGFVAAPQYVTTAIFALRAGEEGDDSIRSGGAGALQAGFGPPGGGAPVAQSYGIATYLTSSAGLEDVIQRGLDVRRMLSSPAADDLVRLDPDASGQALLRAWQRQVTAQFEVTRGTITLRTRAFSAADSYEMAKAGLAASERMVNAVITRMHQDALGFAEEQANLAEERLSRARANLRAFRVSSGLVDANRASDSSLDLQAKLRQDLVAAEAQAESIRAAGGGSSPMLSAALARARALRQQLMDAERQVSRNGSDKNGSEWATLVDGQETLTAKVALAERQLGQTLDLLQQARSNAQRQRSYILTYVRPVQASEATFPNRPLSMLIVGACALLAWAVTMLFTRAIRDHA